MKKYIKLINNEMFVPAVALLRSAEWRDPVKMSKKIIRHFHQDSLYRNSIYLMLSTFIMAFFGFFFWIINTKLFTPEQIGLATALISSITLIGSLSLLGLNLGIVRYLPKSDQKNDKINTVFTIVFLSSLAFSLIYLIRLDYFAPKLLFVKDNVLFMVIFVIIVVFFALDGIVNNVFTAYRDTKFVLIKSIIASVFKLIAPLFLLTLGAYAIFISATFGSVITFFISLIILYKYFNYKFKFKIDKAIFSRMFKLSFGNYIASFTAGLPLTVMPILITNRLGAKQAAYYFMAMSIVSLLLTVQKSVNASLFAEGSADDKDLKKLIFKSIKFIALFSVPTILVIVLFGQYILLFFGKEYSTEGINLLRLLAISALFTSINGTFGAILNIKGKVKYILYMCLIGPAILIPLVYISIPHGLTSLGYAWLAGEGIIALIYILFVYFKVL